jgi:predicted alpha/beta hydrolase
MKDAYYFWETTMLKIPTTDGFELAATLHEAQSPSDNMIMVAMGVKRSYYQHFANFLAEHGFHVLTFDYRGVGDSSPTKLHGFPASLYTWGTQDLAGGVRRQFRETLWQDTVNWLKDVTHV